MKTLDASRLDAATARLERCRVQRAALDVEEIRALVEFAEACPPDQKDRLFSETAVALVGLAMGWTRNYANTRLIHAVTLTRRLPDAVGALERGDLDMYKSRVLVDLTDPLPPDMARAVAERVLPRAGEQSGAAFRQSVRRAVLRVDPEGAQRRHEARTRYRRIDRVACADAMGEITAYLTAAETTAIYTRIDALARAAATSGDPRTIDVRRADVFVDLLMGRETPTASSVVHVTVPLDTLRGGHEPAELSGYGSIPAEMARQIAADGVWRRIVTDPVSKTVLDCGRTTYRPPAALADFVRARDRRCRFPGCIRNAEKCDIDHLTPYPEGPTAPDNLHCLCRPHHKLKQLEGWGVEYRGNTAVWSTPTGRKYEDPPPDELEWDPPPDEAFEDPPPDDVS